MSTVQACLLAAIPLIASPAAHAQSSNVTIEARPNPVYIEQTSTARRVSLEFLITNGTPDSLTLGTIELTVLDGRGDLEVRKFVDENGPNPSIATLGERGFGAGTQRMVFTPFDTFDPELDLATLSFRMVFATPDNRKIERSVLVHPRPYLPKTALALPVSGRVIVWHGHDAYSHHRRFDYTASMIRDLGFQTIAGRYSYDFVHIDSGGAMHHGDPSVNENWLGFAAPVRAVAPGTVVSVWDRQPDNRRMDIARLRADLMEAYGNYIVVDQGHGEFAVYGHIRQSSACCHVGERIRRGQLIAAIGASGSSLFPHLHFQIQTTADMTGEGLPSRFMKISRWLGSRRVQVSHGAIDTGDILETRSR